MARYGDLDTLAVKWMLVSPEQRKTFRQIIDEHPSTDVVPKSEVLELFVEIENVINNELQNNYKVLPQFEFLNELWNKMSGRIEALKEICDFIAELKKKYTEGK